VAGIDAPHQRASPRHRLSVGARAGAHADPRHRRLSGEWLLDLPLLDKSYAEWSADTCACRRSRRARRSQPSGIAISRTLNADAPENEQDALQAARLFTEYLKACRDDRYAMSLLPPAASSCRVTLPARRR
jgi:predicted YcjX-like family ATPase